VGGATVSVAVVASRTEAKLIVGMLRSHGVSAACRPMMPQDSTHRCSWTVFACWLPPPMRPGVAVLRAPSRRPTTDPVGATAPA
jgi:hypothetical protein